MQRLADWEQFQQDFNRIKRSASGYSSNLYAGREQIEDWIARGQLFCLAGTEACLFLRRDRDFYHVFHVTASPQALLSGLRDVPPQQCVLTVDLVGMPAALEPWTDAYRSAGFEPHTSLCRMSRSGQVAAATADDDVSVAAPDDAGPVALLFERLLDRHAEQLPSVEELAHLATQGRVLLAREKGQPCAVLIFDLKARSAVLRYWHVDDHARGRGVGGRLMRQFLARCADASRITLWVKANNAASISIYRYYGFETDSLIDEIMIKLPQGTP